MLVGVWLFVVIIGPMYPASQVSLAKSESATNLTVFALSNAMPKHAAGVDRQSGHNLDLYDNKKAFEETLIVTKTMPWKRLDRHGAITSEFRGS